MIDIRIKVNDDKKKMEIEMETRNFFANENEERFYKFLVESINQYKKFEESSPNEPLAEIEKRLQNMLDKMED